MFNVHFAVYLGEEKEEGFTGFIAEDNFFSILEIDGNYSKEAGRELLKKISQTLLNTEIKDLANFELVLSEKIKEANLPADFSLACGYLNNNIFYLKTIGLGEIYLRRDNEFAKLIGETKSATGYVKKNDFFIFSSFYFNRVLGGEEEIKKIFDHRKPAEIVEELTPQIKGKNDKGIIALIITFDKKDEELIEEEGETLIAKNNETDNIIKSTLFSIRDKILQLRQQSQTLGQQKQQLTFIILAAILFILIWSVGLGYQRRNQAKIDNKIKIAKDLIMQNLSEAEDVAFLNLPRSLVLISEAKDELNKLKKEVGKSKEKEISALEKSIQDKESKFLKKEEKNSQEFFDLAVEEKEAKGDRLSLFEDNLAILNPQGKIYSLSIEKKSLDKKSFAQIKQSTLIVNYQNIILFYNSDQGIYKIDENNQLKKVIEKDEDWGKIADLKIYNGNLYLLDLQKDEVYKYLVTENGYASKSSYFKSGEAIDLNGANSLSIDASVYICFNKTIVKYTTGVKDDFKTSFPTENINLYRIFTDKNIEKVYGWDKTNGMIYVLAKNGTYERQIRSEILNKANDFIVYKNNAYILSGQKIYKINLD